MRPFDSLKTYIGYFQNQLVKVHNCSEDAFALAFISGLRITHPLYKHLVKYNVTRWSNVLYRAQLYIQLEEAMKSSVNPSFNRGKDGTKLKPQHGGPSIDLQGHGQCAFKKQLFPHSQQDQPRAYQIYDSFNPAEAPDPGRLRNHQRSNPG